MAEAPPNLDQAQLKPKGVNIPPTYWTMVLNVSPGWTYIVVPTGGTLWLFYEWGNRPAQQIYVWHQGGQTTPVSGGENYVQVGPGDMIVYQLANPTVDSIKLGYQMV